MLLERIATCLELARRGRTQISWSAPDRERLIIRDVATCAEGVVDCEPSDVADTLRNLSFWIWSLCRHPHWSEDFPRDLFLATLSMETRELGICTGLLSIGVDLGGPWPAPWPEIRDESDEAPLLELLRQDRARLEQLGRSLREDLDCVARLRAVAARLRRAVDGVVP